MNFKNEKGSITVYVLVAVFFLMAILVGRFIIANRNLKVQYDSLAKVKSLYETNAKRYENYNNPDDPNNPGGPGGSGGSTQKTHEIYIFNHDAFDFFNEKFPVGTTSAQKRFFVYQSGIHYILNTASKNSEQDVLVEDSQKYKMTYKLMSDIAVPYSGEEVLEMKIMPKLDFNNHIIYTNAYTQSNKDNLESYNYNNGYVFWDGSAPAIGKS